MIDHGHLKEHPEDPVHPFERLAEQLLPPRLHRGVMKTEYSEYESYAPSPAQAVIERTGVRSCCESRLRRRRRLAAEMSAVERHARVELCGRSSEGGEAACGMRGEREGSDAQPCSCLTSERTSGMRCRLCTRVTVR